MSSTEHVLLRDVMSVGIGAVTGDADFFLLNESQRLKHRLPKSVLRPVVSRARHVHSANVTSEMWTDYLNNDERVWLFWPRESDVKGPRVRAYMNRKPEQGGCRRNAFKIKNRTPWWRTPIPPEPHAFLSGMTDFGPVVCFKGKPRLTATNTLYTVRFARTIEKKERVAWALMLLTTSAREQIEAAYRTYALGLKKLEPSDIGRLRIPIPRCSVSLATYEKVVEAAMEGEWVRASRIADQFIKSAK